MVWVPSASNDASELDEMLSAVSTRVPQIKPVMLEAGAGTAIKEKNLSNLVVIGASLIGPLKFADELRSPQRCTIVVQGTSAGLASATTSVQASVASR